jgi:putative membrane protein
VAYVFPFRALPGAQQAMLASLIALLLLVQVDQPFPELAPLQHIPTGLLLLAAPRLLLRWPLGNASIGMISLFLVFHIIGGRYIYSYVPYDDLARMLSGGSLSQPVGWTRNHYDRFVHFAFGLLLVPPQVEIYRRSGGIPRSGALLIALSTVMAISCLYEIFEWLLTLVLAGPLADGYNGQQGDPWDAQKDMALATFGALAAIAISQARVMSRGEDRKPLGRMH